MTGINRILVANRGEIALRIMRSAREMGIGSVAVYTAADAGSPHVSFADRAICIGEGPVSDSYLNGAKLIAAAQEAGADAVHPGYGFLSENADFAQACQDAGLIFIGPRPDAIALMGNKAEAKRRMIAAGVPCVPGYEGADQSPTQLLHAADLIGFPVMIKAAAGGGGRGMRLVEAAAEFETALDLAKAEALSAFGSDEVILEKAVMRPRHVEIQVFADTMGQTIHLAERDCSVQRRHQKVVEEAPSPAVSADLRACMGAAAVEAAKAIGYLGAGTVEFLLDENGDFYFLEMNTRLQVEHPVTEEITGLDLVALQIQVAAGAPLGLAQEAVTLNGHAIEVRLYAEDPTQDFLPQAGRIALWQPPIGVGIRVDAGICSGQDIAPFYDPMLAKVIAHGATRAEALQRLRAGLQDLVLFGVISNRDFLFQVLAHPEFAAGKATTAFIGEHFSGGLRDQMDSHMMALAAALIYRTDQARMAGQAGIDSALLGWGSPGLLQSRLRVLGPDEDAPVTLRLSDVRGVLHIEGAGWAHELTGSDHEIRIDGTRVDLRHWHMEGDTLFLATGMRQLSVIRHKATNTGLSAEDAGEVRAPMHGALVDVQVAVGETVIAGQRLAVLEAMKMQHEILATAPGRITAVAAIAGTQVKAGDLLIELEAE